MQIFSDKHHFPQNKGIHESEAVKMIIYMIFADTTDSWSANTPNITQR